MNKSTSLYLDFLRVMAAFGVLFVHADLPWFSNSLFLPEGLGHKLVMIFFVLSGYLIAYTVDKKNKGSKKYLVDRFSRLYSVVLPALVFTYILDFIGKHFNAGFYLSQVAPDHQLFRFLINASFLSQIWGLCTKPSSNGPFWSISYEFWYYMLFWAACYLRGGKRYIGVLFICLLIGVKILILFPVWLFGVATYHISIHLTLRKKIVQLLFLITTVLIIILTFYWDFSFLSDKFVFGHAPLYFSSRFVFDWVYGALIAINILSVGSLDFFNFIPAVIEKSIKSLSAMTFSLYLYHLPLLIFIAAIVPYNKSSYLNVIPIIAGIVILVGILSQVTEKQRGNWKIFFEKIFTLFSNKTA